MWFAAICCASWYLQASANLRCAFTFFSTMQVTIPKLCHLQNNIFLNWESWTQDNPFESMANRRSPWCHKMHQYKFPLVQVVCENRIFLSHAKLQTGPIILTNGFIPNNSQEARLASSSVGSQHAPSVKKEILSIFFQSIVFIIQLFTSGMVLVVKTCQRNSFSGCPLARDNQAHSGLSLHKHQTVSECLSRTQLVDIHSNKRCAWLWGAPQNGQAPSLPSAQKLLAVPDWNSPLAKMTCSDGGNDWKALFLKQWFLPWSEIHFRCFTSAKTTWPHACRKIRFNSFGEFKKTKVHCNLQGHLNSHH